VAEDAVHCEQFSLLTGKSTGISSSLAAILDSNAVEIGVIASVRRHSNRDFCGAIREGTNIFDNLAGREEAPLFVAVLVN